MLAGQMNREVLNPGDVSARASEAGDEARRHQISRCPRDNRKRAGHLLHALSLGNSCDDKDIRAPPDQLRSQFWNALDLIAEGAALGEVVPPVHPPKFPHPFVEWPLAHRC